MNYFRSFAALQSIDTLSLQEEHSRFPFGKQYFDDIHCECLELFPLIASTLLASSSFFSTLRLLGGCHVLTGFSPYLPA